MSGGPAAVLGSPEATWSAYSEWNTRIADRFYSPQFAQRLAYLNLSEDVLRELSHARASEKPAGEFTRLIAATLDLKRTGYSLFAPHLQRLRSWRAAHTLQPPPCIALLGFFALIAERMSADEQFASHNYYGRLARWLNIPEVEQQDLIRDFRRDTPLFWHALNSWLESCKGERGLPTAYAFDHRRYVGLPISQSLLREADRNHLPECFMAFGLRGGQRIAIGDMQTILSDWIPVATVSARLKRLWAQEQVKGRIAEIACLELEAWDGAQPGSAAVGGSNALLFAAAIQNVPRLRVEFALLARESGSVAAGRYRLLQSRPENSNSVLEESLVALTEAPFAGYLMVRTALRYDRALLSHVRLQPISGSGRPLERRWKQVVVLRYESDGKLYVETKRVELAEDHIVLAHESIEPQVHRYLKEVTGGGLQRLTSFDNPSVPPQWTAFLGVRVTGVSATNQEELQALVPVATTSILLEGGLSLPGRSTWHVRCPPQITVVSLTRKRLAVWIQSLPNTDESLQNREEIPLGDFLGSATWSLQQLDVPTGDYRLIVAESQAGARPVATAAVRLRCGDFPRNATPSMLGHVPSDPRWPLSAADVAADYCGPMLRGAHLIDWSSTVLLVNADAALPERLTPGEVEVALEATGATAPDESTDTGKCGAPTQPPVCATRAHHYWVLPSADRDAPKYQELLGRCRDCGLERWFRPSRRSQFQRRRAVHFHQRPARAIPLTFQTGPLELSGDSLLDALTYLQSGDQRELAALFEPLDARIYVSEEFIRLLTALGHLDVRLADDCSHVVSWRVADATLVEILPGAAILAGARSKRMLDRIAEDVLALGGSVSIEAQEPAPSRICITGLDERRLREVASSAGKALDILITASRSPCTQLANALPPLRQLFAVLPRERWPELPTEYFDLASRKWCAVARPMQQGAYRFGLAPRMYGFVDETALKRREMARADHRTVKHLAAAFCAQPLLAYSATAQALQAPLGADLPYIYERVVVLASGVTPQKRVDGIVHYSGVPPTIARRVWLLMGGTTSVRSSEVACQIQ